MSSRNLVGFVVGAFASLALAGSAAHAATIVNCIGEQTTTTGEGVTGPTQLWPQQLGMLLGATYTVNNDGVNAGTVVAGTAKSATSLVGPPNIVIIGPFAEHDYAAGITEATWQADYKKLVDAYLALTPAPTVYVMTPPPAAFVYQMGALEQTFATDVVKPAVLAVAAGDNSAAKTLKVIDLFSDAALVTAADAFGDGHFTAAGHHEVAVQACIALGKCTATTGTGGSGGTTGTAGAGGTTGTGTGGSGGTTGTGTGTAGTTGTGTGTAGTTGGAGTTGASGTTGAGTGAAGTTGAGTGTAGSSATGTGTGAAGTGAPQRSSSGGCAVGGRSTTGTLAGLLVAMALAAPAWRRRRRGR